MSIRDIKRQAAGMGKLTVAYNKYLLGQARTGNSHWDGKYHASMIGGCPTAAAMQILQFGFGSVVDSADGLRIFRHGHAIHTMLQADLFGCGCIKKDDRGFPRVEVPVVCTIEHRVIVGTADGELDPSVYKEDAVLELKSINSNSLKIMMKEPRPVPKDEHRVQGSIYCRAMRCGLVVFLYYGKDTSEILEIPYRPTPADVSLATSRYDAIAENVENWRTKRVFPVPYFNAQGRPPCSYCKWKSVCHATFEREAFITKCKEESDHGQTAVTAAPCEAPVKSRKLPPIRGVRKVRVE